MRTLREERGSQLAEGVKPSDADAWNSTMAAQPFKLVASPGCVNEGGRVGGEGGGEGRPKGKGGRKP
jgi:hypothetical protein